MKDTNRAAQLDDVLRAQEHVRAIEECNRNYAETWPVETPTSSTSGETRPLLAIRTQPRFANMSSAQRSASMDNIVRQVETLTQQANAQQREIVRVAQRTADFVYDINTDRWESPGEKHNYGIIVAQIARVDARCDDYLDFRHRSFWQRLRWLVTGR